MFSSDQVNEASAKDIWNYKIIDAPPIVTFDYTLAEYRTSFSSNNFQVIFEQHLNKLFTLIKSNQEFFKTETTLLKKLIFKNWNSLRKERSMRSMQRLKKVLNSFEEFQFENLLKTMIDLIDSRQIQYSLNKKSLPSKEVFEHFLVRIYGVFRLLEFAQMLIRENIFFYLVKSIQMAVFMPNNLLFLGTVSRIYCVVKKYSESITFVYNSLRQHMHLFKSTNIKWSTELQIETLPESISANNHNNNSINKSGSNSIRLLESKIEQLDLLTSKTNETANNSELNNTMSSEDIGVLIERTDEINSHTEESPLTKSTKPKLFVKWKQLLIQHIQKQIGLIFKNGFDKKLLKKKFQRKLNTFLEVKISKLNDAYRVFLQEIIGKEKSIKEISNKINLFTAAEKKAFSKLLKTSITNYISK